jgi:hypothetical protein
MSCGVIATEGSAYFRCRIEGNDLPSNGNQCLNWLSHLSGQAQ